MFAARRVRVATGATRIGADGVKFRIENGDSDIEAVGWGLGHRTADLRPGAIIDIAYKLERNEFRGKSTLQLGLADFRVSA